MVILASTPSGSGQPLFEMVSYKKHRGLYPKPF
jgi:hypothetical protein